MLAVHVEQAADDFAQLLHRHGLAIEIGARAAVGVDHAAHQQFVIGRDGLLFEQVAQRTRHIADVEGGGDFSLSAPARIWSAAARAPQTSISASTTIDLPAPVSPVSTVRPWRKLELERVDDGKVPDLEVGEHVRAFSAG